MSIKRDWDKRKDGLPRWTVLMMLVAIVLYFAVILGLGLVAFDADAADDPPHEWVTGQLLILTVDGQRELVEWKAPEHGGTCALVQGRQIELRAPGWDEWRVLVEGRADARGRQ